MKYLGDLGLVPAALALVFLIVISGHPAAQETTQPAESTRPAPKANAPVTPQQVQQDVSQMVQEVVDLADALSILDAYLTDQEAVAKGKAPKDFKLLTLDEYKAKGISRPLTQKAAE